VGVDAAFIDAITQKAGSGSMAHGFDDAAAYAGIAIAQRTGPR